MNEEEKKRISDALNLITQQRYVWLFTHIARSHLLEGIDSGKTIPFSNYYFAQDEIGGDHKPINVSNVLQPLSKRSEAFASNDDGSEIYGWEYVRKATLDGWRGTIIIAIQAYLEKLRIRDLSEKYFHEDYNIFEFLRLARNIVIHSKDGSMDDPRITECTWRDVTIKRSDEALKMSDRRVFELITDAISSLVKVCISHDIKIDYITLNLGYTDPAIREYIENVLEK